MSVLRSVRIFDRRTLLGRAQGRLSGELAKLSIMWRHILLIFSSENADKDACAMEHIISPEAFDKIEELVVKHKKN